MTIASNDRQPDTEQDSAPLSAQQSAQQHQEMIRALAAMKEELADIRFRLGILLFIFVGIPGLYLVITVLSDVV